MCGIIGFIDRTKSKIDGSSIKAGLSLMNERGSGDGAGYAAYGIYPEYANYYALHVFFDNLTEPKKKVDELLQQWGEIVHQEEIPNTPQMGIKKVHIPWRYFFKPSEDLTEKCFRKRRCYVHSHAGKRQYNRSHNLFLREKYGSLQGFRLARGCSKLL